jgi:hypothetical protein
MKRLILTAAAASTMLFAVATVDSAALAAPIAPSTALPDAARSLDQLQDVRTVCRRVWRHGTWHRRCWWEPNRHRGWGHRHRGWRHRHWR